MTLTKEQIISRENRICSDAMDAKQDPIFWIARDRKQRWSEYLKDLVVRDEITNWVEVMKKQHGESCRAFNSTVGWVVALLICRYGEAEYHWPNQADGFTDEDVARADEWRSGRIPEGFVHFQ